MPSVVTNKRHKKYIAVNVIYSTEEHQKWVLSRNYILSLSLFFVYDSISNYRSSCPEVFCKRGILRNFTKFTGIHPRQSLFFNKVTGLRPVLRNFTNFTGKQPCQILFYNKVPGLRPATLLKKRLLDRCFPVIFVKFLRTPFYTEHLSVAASVIMNKTKYCHAKLLSIYFCNKKIIEETIQRLWQICKWRTEGLYIISSALSFFKCWYETMLSTKKADTWGVL